MSLMSTKIEDIFWYEGVYYEENTDKLLVYSNGQITTNTHLHLGIQIMLQSPFGYAMSNYQFIYLGEF